MRIIYDQGHKYAEGVCEIYHRLVRCRRRDINRKQSASAMEGARRTL